MIFLVEHKVADILWFLFYRLLILLLHLIAAADAPGEGRKSLRTQFDSNHSFFYAELPECTTLSHVIEENEIFPAQFGREVS